MLLESYVKVIDVLGLFFDISSMEFYTTRHWLTSGRLVQELDFCTVVIGTLASWDKRRCTYINAPHSERARAAQWKLLINLHFSKRVLFLRNVIEACPDGRVV